MYFIYIPTYGGCCGTQTPLPIASLKSRRHCDVCRCLFWPIVQSLNALLTFAFAFAFALALALAALHSFCFAHCFSFAKSDS